VLRTVPKLCITQRRLHAYDYNARLAILSLRQGLNTTEIEEADEIVEGLVRTGIECVREDNGGDE